MAKPNLANPVTATLSGAMELFQKKVRIGDLKDDERIDGKTVVITGANSGLGFAIAVHLAQRGGKIIMACRSGIPEAGEKVKKMSGSGTVEMRKVDLSDLDQIDTFCKQLQADGIRIDILVLNAGIVPAESRKTPQGLNEMFMVNYFSSFVMLDRLLRNGTLPNAAFGNNPAPAGEKPRIIFIASESHRSGADLDLDHFGSFVPYTIGKAVAFYGYYKLMLVTFARELSRRLNPDEAIPDVSVFTLCPGAVNTNIIKAAPGIFKPILKTLFFFFFQDSFKADEPACYFACSRDMSGKTNRYLHRMTAKEIDERGLDPIVGKRLWEESDQLLHQLQTRP